MKKLVENHEYQIKDFKVHLSRQANHSQFTNFNFVFSPFTKLKNTSSGIYGRPNVSKFAKLKFVVAILNSLSLNSNSLSLT